MAGSYNHVVTDDGNLGSNDFVVSVLENGDDVFETVEEMYGMIWWLAKEHIGSFSIDVDERTEKIWAATIKGIVEEARQHYEEGLEIAKKINEGD